MAMAENNVYSLAVIRKKTPLSFAQNKIFLSLAKPQLKSFQRYFSKLVSYVSHLLPTYDHHSLCFVNQNLFTILHVSHFDP